MDEKPQVEAIFTKGGDERDKSELISCLVVLVHTVGGGKVNISPETLQSQSGKIGLRARYEEDGSLTLWTYGIPSDGSAASAAPRGEEAATVKVTTEERYRVALAKCVMVSDTPVHVGESQGDRLREIYEIGMAALHGGDGSASSAEV